MSEYCFNMLLEKLYVYLKKKNTHWRKAITPKKWLVVCIRYVIKLINTNLKIIN